MILATILFNMSIAIQEIERVKKNSKLAKYYIIPDMKILFHHSVNDF